MATPPKKKSAGKAKHVLPPRRKVGPPKSTDKRLSANLPPHRQAKKKPPPKPNGGKRKGAGRKNVETMPATRRTRAIAEKLAAEAGVTPLEYMLAVLNETAEDILIEFADENISEMEMIVKLKDLTSRKDWAAQQAAPYIHPKLSSIEQDNGGGSNESFLDDLD